MRFELNQREATPEERAFLDSSARSRSAPACAPWRGSRTARTRRWWKSRRSMRPIRSTAAGHRTALPPTSLFAARDGVFGAAAPDILFDRLGLSVGGRILLGTQHFELRAKIVTEPDAISDGFGFAPRLLISLEGLRAAGLIQPGSLVEHVYKVKLPAGDDQGRHHCHSRSRAQRNFPTPAGASAIAAMPRRRSPRISNGFRSS